MGFYKLKHSRARGFQRSMKMYFQREYQGFSDNRNMAILKD